MQLSKAEALAAISRLEEICRDYGYPNENSKQEMLRIVQTLRNDGPDDDYFREKLFSVSKWAEIGFSTKKFAKHPGGASQVTVWTLGDCGTARNLVRERWPRD